MELGPPTFGVGLAELIPPELVPPNWFPDLMPPDPQIQATSTAGQPSWMAPVTPVIPDHELIRRIGGGSYGDVWLARTTVGSWRAAKVVFRDRFTDARPYEREFSGMQKFEPLSRGNEAFVDILQIGRNDADGYFYYVMELADDAMEGGRDPSSVICHRSDAPEWRQSLNTRLDPASYVPRTLSKVLLQRGRLAVGECLELGLTLNLGLAQLHRAGLIHRDIKPSNLIFVGGVPKLADIGLVIEVSEARSFVGTEGFIPPEGPNSPQADLYSLGKVLYEAGMGKDRKDFPEPLTQLGEVPDSAQLLEFNAILLRACAASRTERYQSAEEMNADLALLQSGGSVRRQRKVARQLRFVRRAAAVVTAFAIVIALGWWWQARQTAKVRELGEEKSRVAAEKTALAGALARAGERDRDRLIRLGIANGNRLLEEGDPAGALVWFAETLPLLTNNPAAESTHRIRLQQALNITPRVLQVMPHESGVAAAAFSPDGRRVVTGTQDGNLRVWNAADGTLLWGPKSFGAVPAFVRFSRDGAWVFATSSAQQGPYARELPTLHGTAVLDAQSGESLFGGNPEWAGLATNQVSSAFSPDDRWVAVAQPDHVVRLFALTNGQPVLELRGHSDAVPFLSFSAEGSLLVSASADRTVRLWRLPSGKPFGPPFEHRWSVVRALLTADGKRLVTSSFETPPHGAAEIHVWDVTTQRRAAEPVAVRDEISAFPAPGLPGRFFVQDRDEARLRAYGLDQLKELSGCPDLTGVRCWDFSRDGSRVALGNGNRVAQVFDTRTGAALTPPFRHSIWGVTAVQFSPDENQLLTACADGSARIWELRPPADDSLSRPLPEGFALFATILGSMNLGQSPGGLPILLGDRSISLINDQLEEVRRFTARKPGDLLVDIQSSPDGRTWYLPEYAGAARGAVAAQARLHRQDEGGQREYELPHPGGVHAFDFSGDGAEFITIAGDRGIRFWRTRDGQLAKVVATPELAGGFLQDLSATSRTGLWLQTVAEGKPASVRYRFFDLDSGKPIGDAFELLGTDNYSLYSPDGRRLALWGEEGPVTVIDARTGRIVSASIRHPLSLRWAQWNPDGRRILTVGGNDEARVWDAETGRELLTPLRTAGSRLVRAVWSADGRFVVTVSRGKNNAVLVWDALTGDRVTPPLAHGDYVRFATITPGQHLVTGAFTEPSLRSWALRESPLPAGVLAEFARLLAGRRRGDGGELAALPAGELAGLGRTLRAAQPGLFTIPREELIRRHRRAVGRTGDLAQLNSALWQLDRLTELAPDDPEIQQLRRRYQAMRVPPRMPGTPTNLIDLSPFYTWSLDTTWSGEFAALPRGLQTLAATRWDVRGVATVGAGEALTRIPVQQHCTRLHFLQFIGGGQGRDGVQVAHWVVRYADGSSVEWPLIYGEHLRDCWWNDGQPREARQAEIAWEGRPNIPAKGVRLFKATWTNPRPEVPIESLDLLGADAPVTTAVVALTAE